MNKGLVHEKIFTESSEDTANHKRMTECMAEKIACAKFVESDVALSGFKGLVRKESHQLYSEDLSDFQFKLSHFTKT